MRARDDGQALSHEIFGDVGGVFLGRHRDGRGDCDCNCVVDAVEHLGCLVDKCDGKFVRLVALAVLKAQPPLAGVKFAANLWLHQYDFRYPNTHGCDMDKPVNEATLQDEL